VSPEGQESVTATPSEVVAEVLALATTRVYSTVVVTPSVVDVGLTLLVIKREAEGVVEIIGTGEGLVTVILSV
jgi:hypothetical protein